MKNLFKLISATLLLITATTAYSKDRQTLKEIERNNQFVATKWSNGYYFISGIGPTSSINYSRENHDRSVIGVHLLASIGYWMENLQKFFQIKNNHILYH